MWLLLVASAAAQTSPYFTVNCTPEGPIAFGEPTEVSCGVEAREYRGEVGTWESAVWLVGDGTVYEGDEFVHTYTESGTYTLSVELEGFALDRDTGIVELDSQEVRTRLGDYYTLCGPPEPEFEIVDKGGLTYDVVNTTAVDQARCLRSLDFEIRRSRGDQVLQSFQTWEPSFELPSEGLYFVSLEVDGVGGAARAEVELDAEFNLTSDYYRVYARPCSTAPVGSGLGMLVILAIAAGRRRSR